MEQTSLKIEKETITVSGVKSVGSVNDREATLNCADCKLLVKGSGLTVSKLNVDDGVLVLKFSSLSALNFFDAQADKFSVKNLFR